MDKLTLIHWIAIYPVDSVIQPLNNWGQVSPRYCATLMYKAKNSCSKLDYSKLRTFNTASETVTLKYLVLILPVMENTVRYEGPYIWSKLSKELRTSQTLTTFKMTIRKIDLSGLIEKNSSFPSPPGGRGYFRKFRIGVCRKGS